MTAIGIVHLVGAGPGDPLLLTRRAARLLTEADVVVADRRSADPIVALAPPTAERIYVGRTDVGPAWEGPAVVRLLAARAQAGCTVVRLKSGDPFVCSRGGEEANALAALGVACKVTPGVTAAFAAALATGADRGRTVTVASGDDDPLAASIRWEDLADPTASLIVLTGRAHQGQISARLLEGAGLPRGTPTWVVHAAGRPGTKVRSTTLAALGGVRLPPPAAFVVGPCDAKGFAGAHP